MSEQMWNAVLGGDSFSDYTCEKCGLRASLFTLAGATGLSPGTLAALCPNCVVKRINNLENRQNNIPAGIAVLREEARRRVEKQTGEEPSSFFDVYSDFAVCDKCSKTIYAEDALPEQLSLMEEGTTFCPECFDQADERTEVDRDDATLEYAGEDAVLEHSSFVSGYQSGSLTVHVDRNAAGYLYEQEGLILEKHRTLQAMTRSFFFGGVIGGIALLFFVQWYFALAVLLFGIFMSRVATRAAARGVLQTALVRPRFYKKVKDSGILRFEKDT